MTSSLKAKREAKAAANRQAAQAAHAAKRAEALALLARLTETLQTEPRYQTHDDTNWADTGTMLEISHRLGLLSDLIHGEGEYEN